MDDRWADFATWLRPQVYEHVPAARVATVAAAFGLSPFETDLLLLCAAVELDTGAAELCGEARGSAGPSLPTFDLARAVLPAPHWSAIGAQGPLRHWELIEFGAGDTLAGRPLRISARILLHLLGVDQLEERLLPLFTALRPDPAVPPPATARRLAACWAGTPDSLVQLRGAAEEETRAIVAAACAIVGVEGYALTAPPAPEFPAQRYTFARLWEREALLSGRVLLAPDGLVATGVADWQRGRPGAVLDVPAPSPDEQRTAWRSALVDSQLTDRLVSTFTLTPAMIRTVTEQAAATGEQVWQVCVVRNRPQLDGLAQRVPTAVTWDDLVLAPAQQRSLRAIARHVRQRSRVHHGWGFPGYGVSALFTGSSGTGKTMAAAVLANELGLDLYRIDLSGVVSRYVGETEKNLGRVFDAAETSGAVLLFDEADALFGRRGEVRDSHDRYANIEVSYLLQRMETYTGLAVLTSNLPDGMDEAFRRRLRFVVRFPFPDAALRAEIWRRAFPPGTPTTALDLDLLANLQVAGGGIRNIALGAAMLAAEAGESVGMRHLRDAALDESIKDERPLVAAEIRGWATENG